MCLKALTSRLLTWCTSPHGSLSFFHKLALHDVVAKLDCDSQGRPEAQLPLSGAGDPKTSEWLFKVSLTA